jgi:hypothetical protein
VRSCFAFIGPPVVSVCCFWDASRDGFHTRYHGAYSKVWRLTRAHPSERHVHDTLGGIRKCKVSVTFLVLYISHDGELTLQQDIELSEKTMQEAMQLVKEYARISLPLLTLASEMSFWSLSDTCWDTATSMRRKTISWKLLSQRPPWAWSKFARYEH